MCHIPGVKKKKVWRRGQEEEYSRCGRWCTAVSCCRRCLIARPTDQAWSPPVDTPVLWIMTLTLSLERGPCVNASGSTTLPAVVASSQTSSPVRGCPNTDIQLRRRGTTVSFHLILLNTPLVEERRLLKQGS
ncbi:uncharacterized protein LOC144115775 [Amblyomma americanum]